jgi:hypothetical protein
MMTMENEKTYLDRTQRLAELRNGQRLSDDDIVANFLLYNSEKRIEILDAIDKDLGSGTDLRKMSEELHLRRQLGDMHVSLRKANR